MSKITSYVLPVLAVGLLALALSGGCSLIPGYNADEVRQETIAVAEDLSGVNEDIEEILGELKRVAAELDAAKEAGDTALLAELVEEGQALAGLLASKEDQAKRLGDLFERKRQELEDAEQAGDYVEWVVSLIGGGLLSFLGIKPMVARRDEALGVTAANAERSMSAEDFLRFKELQSKSLSDGARKVLDSARK